MLAVIYLVFILIDWTLLLMGDFIEYDHFYCYDSIYLSPATALGSWYLIFQTLYFMVFSFMLWFIFFYIPKKYGMLMSFRT
mmetsp:Transcript_33724/g.32756  ORF Transcript_33724/g.32756 Transcript_33724/m.32756 type:complete len:81 (+) Transcript_33724:377-619(+)